jgi:hypothetical protein
MIRIGFSRWFIDSGKVPMDRGQVKHYITLRPQAERFRIFASEWKGIHHAMVEKEVPAEPVTIESIDDAYGLVPLKEMQLVRKLASEAASDAVYKCYASGILSHRPPETGRYLGEVDTDTMRLMAIYMVEQAIMKSVQSGIVDQDETVELVDLVPHMRELYEQQERERQERIRLRQEALEQMRLDQQFDRERYEKMQEGATKTSFDLLMSVLSSKEQEEMDKKGYVTIKNVLGDFRVPVSRHGWVEQYVEGKHTQSHCIVFRDCMIPLGDEIAMKVTFLKADPHKFIQASNKVYPRK